MLSLSVTDGGGLHEDVGAVLHELRDDLLVLAGEVQHLLLHPGRVVERRLADGVGVADEIARVGVVPLDVGQKLLHDRVVAPPARLVQRGLPALHSTNNRSHSFNSHEMEHLFDYLGLEVRLFD